MIQFMNVRKKYMDIVALKDISFYIDEGEFVFIIGQSGAGKSTLSKLLLKEVNPDSGRIFLDGKDITRVSKRSIPKIRRKVGTVFQDFMLLEDMNVYDNISYVLDLIGTKRREKKRLINEVLDLVNLSNRKKAFPRELSGGEQQRVSIARALVTKPSVLIADEPTGNLDPATSLSIVENLLKINENGTTILMITHEEGIVNDLHKRVIHLANGSMVSDKQDGVYDV